MKQQIDLEELSEHIQEHPLNFKICEGCFSLVYRSVGVCPFCSAYQFECSSKKIIEIAKKLTDPEYQKTAIAFDSLHRERGEVSLLI